MVTGTITVTTAAEFRQAQRLGFCARDLRVTATAHCAQEFRTTHGQELVFRSTLLVDDAIITRDGEVEFVWQDGAARLRVRALGGWSLTMTREAV